MANSANSPSWVRTYTKDDGTEYQIAYRTKTTWKTGAGGAPSSGSFVTNLQVDRVAIDAGITGGGVNATWTTGATRGIGASGAWIRKHLDETQTNLGFVLPDKGWADLNNRKSNFGAHVNNNAAVSIAKYFITLGYGKGGKLTEYIRKNPYSLVLFDEVEKAHPDVLNILLQILEEGKVTDSNGRNINFRNTVIVMTTNVGAERIQQPVPIGFVNPDTIEDKNKFVQETALEEVKKHFKPEFLNRIDDLIVFNNLGEKELEKIVQLNFKDYIKRAKTQHNVTLKLNKSAVDLILKEGYDEKFGAREIKRTIKKLFETRYATDLLSGKIPKQSTVSVGARNKKLTLTVSTE